MKLKLAFAAVGLAVAVAACQNGPDMPTAPAGVDPEATESGRIIPAQGCVQLAQANVLTGRQFLGVVLFVGTEGEDVAFGIPDRRNVFVMRGGDDLAIGANLQDSFHGGDGDDTWCGGPGSDAAFGGQGSDFLEGEAGFDRNDGGHTPVPSSAPDQSTDVCFGEANFLCEQSFPDGVVVSSIHFKQNVTYILPEDVSLFGLRPVTFRYREPYESRIAGIQVGLIAEDVARVFPEAVVYGDGLPIGVRYGVVGGVVLDRLGRVALPMLQAGVERITS